jgi:K+-transporting ATPase ATPase C chain
MKQHIVTAVRTTVVLLLLVSGIYPLLVRGIGQLAFREKADGSLLVRDGRVIGSSLIAQDFAGDGYFHPRPSAVDFNAAGSGASNLGPTSRKLAERIASDVKARGTAAIPADAVTTSASGLDPHISPQNAMSQVARVARARGIAGPRLAALVRRRTEGRFLGLFGEPRVNVLLLNLALDDMMKMNAAQR